jgi:nitrate reductase delta subunit
VLELIRSALHDRGSLYAGVLDALCAALPQPSAAQLREMRRLAEEGPPAELVGLESFDVPAPAEVVG